VWASATAALAADCSRHQSEGDETPAELRRVVQGPPRADSPDFEHFGEQTPLGRAGQPAELAPAYVFLASRDASFVTGEVLAVTGGQPV
jgi:NAD(P)-dependent dehydrogenase (short-subunit alcohol dehydrogenase family)